MTIAAGASDNVGVVGVQFKLDGANLGAEDTTAPYAVSWNTTTVPNGAYKYCVEALTIVLAVGTTRGWRSEPVELSGRVRDAVRAALAPGGTFLIEKEPGFGPNPTVPGLTVPGKIEKMGYKVEFVPFDDQVKPAMDLASRLGTFLVQACPGTPERIEIGLYGDLQGSHATRLASLDDGRRGDDRGRRGR